MDEIETFGERLAWTRMRRGLTQAELSDLCGIGTSTLGNLEAGHSSTSKKMGDLAAALCVNREWLASGKGDPGTAFMATPEIAEWKLRLREARRKKGLTRNDLALMINVSNSTVTNWEQSAAQGGIKLISEKKAKIVCRALGVKTEWLFGLADTHERDDEGESGGDSSTVEDEVIEVPRVSLKLTAGSEVFKTAALEDSRKNVSLHTSQVTRLVSIAPSLVAVTVEDESMSPQLMAGDDVVINVADIEKVNAKVYALNIDGSLIFRRLHQDNDVWYMAKQNGEQSPIGPQDHIVGRVVFRQGNLDF